MSPGMGGKCTYPEAPKKEAVEDLITEG